MNKAPLQIFIAYARKDTAFLEEFRIQLKPLERSRKVTIWYDGEIEPGAEWEDSIKKHLHEADIIIMMVSPDAIASDYFYEKEMKDALQRHHAGTATVVPFIIRPCAWQRNTPLGKLQALPKDGKAVTRWDDRDFAYANAVRAIEDMVEKKLADQQAEKDKQETERQATEEAQRKEAAAALAAQQEAERQRLIKKELARQEAVAQQFQAEEEKRRQAEAARLAEQRRQQQAAEAERNQEAKAEKQRQQEAARQRRKEQQQQVAARLRSPWVWGSLLAVLLVFVFLKMCNDPTFNLSGNETAMDSTKVNIPFIDTSSITASNEPPPVMEEEEKPKPQPPTDPYKNKGGDKDSDGICADNDCNDSNKNKTASQDSDGDGLCDDKDDCPQEYGPASNKGCPVKEPPLDPCKNKGGDKDDDGICDDDDCNDNNKNKTASQDSDGDGLCDDKDDCPQEAGAKSNKGCPKKIEPLPSGRKSGFDMVRVRGGTYTMGQPNPDIKGKESSKDECPHKVTVSDFDLGRYEVTQADWQEVMGNDPPSLEFEGCDDCPVEKVSWNDVQIFLKKASEKYGYKYRLPTEEEWEYAARGGSKSKGYTYAGSNKIADVAWYDLNSGDKTHPVGKRKANELGIYDMSGNVWEWCVDKWKAYPSCTATDCSGCRVVRGGSLYNIFFDCRVANRRKYRSNYRYFCIGFRLARY